MSRQSMEIPWDILVSNLGWSAPDAGAKEDLHLLSNPMQEEELRHFIDIFVRNMKKESESGYNPKKYYSEPEWEDIILTDEIVDTITPTVRKVLHGLEYYFEDEYKGCDTLIPYLEREAFSFLRPYFEWQPLSKEGRALYKVEITKILILHGEMDAIFRICQHPGFDFAKWWSVAECKDKDSDLGWNQICITALLAYIGLSVLRRFPESWSSPSNVREYRDTRIYQYMLRSCTFSGPISRVAAHPHREFFGIADGQFKKYRDSSAATEKRSSGTKDRGVSSPALCEGTTKYHRECPNYGVVPFPRFHVTDTPLVHLPSVSDVQDVRSVLHMKGMPMELVLQILDSAGYSPRCKLMVSHDPFHPWNRDLLDEHMDYCWQLLVRCDMTARGVGKDIEWEQLIGACISDLLTGDGDEIISGIRGSAARAIQLASNTKLNPEY